MKRVAREREGAEGEGCNVYVYRRAHNLTQREHVTKHVTTGLTLILLPLLRSNMFQSKNRQFTNTYGTHSGGEVYAGHPELSHTPYVNLKN